MSNEPSFSDFIVYADESGTASLKGIDPDYLIFVLAFVVIGKRHYADVVVPNLQNLKFNFFGHDQVVFRQIAWRSIFSSKQANSAGLQLADLFARPIGLDYLRPDQTNRAFEIIEPKLRRRRYKVFP